MDTVSGTIAKYIKGYTEQLICFEVSPQNISNHDLWHIHAIRVVAMDQKQPR